MELPSGQPTMAIHERFHALDSLRACALLAGILLHAIMSFLPGFREVNWPLSDNSTSSELGILYSLSIYFACLCFLLLQDFLLACFTNV